MGGHLEDGAADQSALALVQEHIFSRSWEDFREGVSCQPGNLPGVDSGAVYNPLSLHLLPLTAGEDKALILPLNVCHPEVPVKGYAVVHGVSHGGDGQLIGADNPGGGGKKHPGHHGRKPRLQSPGFLTGEEGQAGNPVFLTPAVKPLQLGVLLRGEGADESAVVFVRHMKLPGGFVQEGISLPVEPGFESPRLRVVSGVDDAGVGLGGSHGHVVFRFQKTNFQSVPGKLPGSHGAHHPGTDNCHLIFQGKTLLYGCCIVSITYPGDFGNCL